MNAPVLSRIASRPDVSHAEMANAIRFLAIDAVEKAKSGHPGMPMGMADVATVLFSRFLKFDPADPAWPDRDRFVLSAGHGSMLLYALLHLTGYEGVTSDELRAFRQWGSKTPGHPEYGHTPGVETTTGPLGQGIATAVGMALAERLMNARFGDDCVDHFTYVIAGDGCLMEGLSHEAISLAGHLRLNRLIVLFDDNEISIDGATSLSCSDDQLARFKASGWSACRIDGHDPEAIAAAIERARNSDRPSLIACRTLIGFGAPNRQGSEKAHGAPLGAEEVAKTRDALNWPHPPFQIPEAVLAQWRKAGARGHAARRSWIERTRRLNSAARSPFHDALNRNLPCGYVEAMARLRDRFATERPNIATRQASQLVIDGIAEALPNLLGGSADLTHSNLTRAKTHQPVQARLPRRQLHSLWRPRARHGGGDERHRAAWRLHPLWRHVPQLRRLQPPRDQAGGADGHPRHPCDDARLRSDWARMVPPISRSSIWHRCGRSPICWCFAPAMPSRPPRPGIARCGRKITRRCCACRGRRCRRSAKPAASRIWSRSALTSWSSRRTAATSR